MQVVINKEKISSFKPGEESSPFGKLPNEILLYLFSFFDEQTLITAGLVAKRWQLFSKDNSLYQRLFLKAFPDTAKSLSKEKISREQFIHSTQAKNRINNANFFHSLNTLSFEYLMDVKVAYGRIYGLINSKLQVLDAAGLDLFLPFKYPSVDIQSFKIIDKKIYAAIKQNINLYEAESGEFLNKIEFSEAKAIIDFDVSDDIIYAAISNEKAIRRWSQKTRQELNKINVSCFLTSIKVLDPYLYCGYLNGFQVLDKQGKEIRKHENQMDRLLVFEVSKDRIYASFKNDNVYTYLIWETSTGKEIYRYENKAHHVTSIKIHDGHLLLGWSDNSIDIYEAGSQKFLRKLIGSHDAAQLIMYNGNVYNPEESKVNYWDFKPITLHPSI